MDGSRFDSLTRMVSSGASRRTIFKSLLGIGGTTLIGAAVDNSADARRSSGRRETTTTAAPTSSTTTPNPCDGTPCGYDCCETEAQCCDGECCAPGNECIAEEHCCPVEHICWSNPDWPCCGPEQACCDIDGCCSGSCYSGGLCCETSLVCSATNAEACCPFDKPDCCDRGEPVCINRAANECCSDSDCSYLDESCLAGVCNTATNTCATIPANENGPCDDGNACTQTDTCQNGACIGSNPIVCTALDQCHDVGVCNTSTGSCSNPAKADSTPCDDANACTDNDVCTGGVCTGTPFFVDCAVGTWSEFSECTKPCGGGTKIRTRSILTQPSCGGAQCPVLAETEPCNVDPCCVPACPEGACGSEEDDGCNGTLNCSSACAATHQICDSQSKTCIDPEPCSTDADCASSFGCLTHSGQCMEQHTSGLDCSYTVTTEGQNLCVSIFKDACPERTECTSSSDCGNYEFCGFLYCNSGLNTRVCLQGIPQY